MIVWLRQHLLALKHTLARFARAPFATFANIVVMGVVLALPLGTYGLLVNIQGLAGLIPAEPQISLFLAPGQPSPVIEAEIRKSEGVRAVRFVSRDSALATLKRSPGMEEIVSTLQANPLPDAFVITLASGNAELGEKLSARFQALPGVAHVQIDSAWVRRIDSLLGLGRTALLLLGVLLGLALIAVSFNTIRLQILTQREEIEVSKLIGATDTYIRRPFYYLGVLLGVFGGLGALGVVAFSFQLLNLDLGRLGSFYGIQPTLKHMGFGDSGAFLLFAGLLGWLGAYLSVSRHLLSVDPK